MLCPQKDPGRGRKFEETSGEKSGLKKKSSRPATAAPAIPIRPRRADDDEKNQADDAHRPGPVDGHGVVRPGPIDGGDVILIIASSLPWIYKVALLESVHPDFYRVFDPVARPTLRGQHAGPRRHGRHEENDGLKNWPAGAAPHRAELAIDPAFSITNINYDVLANRQGLGYGRLVWFGAARARVGCGAWAIVGVRRVGCGAARVGDRGSATTDNRRRRTPPNILKLQSVFISIDTNKVRQHPVTMASRGVPLRPTRFPASPADGLNILRRLLLSRGPA